jgi:AcrR family transcriptional regulator
VVTVALHAPALLPGGLDLTPSRRRIYEAAIALWGTRGFHGASMRDLADALGIKAPSLYAHVSSKEQLLFEIALIGQTEHRERLSAALLDAGTDPAEQLTAAVRAHVLAHLQLPLLARLTSNETRHLEQEHMDRILTVRRDAERLVLDVVNRGVRRGEFTVANPPRTLRAIADMGIRAADWPIAPDPAEYDDIADEYAAIALRIVRG